MTKHSNSLDRFDNQSGIVSHPAQWSVERLLAACEIKRTRGSGPGGQHRNKVETAIVVEHSPTGLRGEASERRSQEQNRRQAILRLRVKLALEVRCEPSRPPSELWRQRSTGGRLTVSAAHDDFPALLAEALDVIQVRAGSIPAAAEQLGITASQLVKFLKVEPVALAGVNRERSSRGENPLR